MARRNAATAHAESSCLSAERANRVLALRASDITCDTCVSNRCSSDWSQVDPLKLLLRVFAHLFLMCASSAATRSAAHAHNCFRSTICAAATQTSSKRTRDLQGTAGASGKMSEVLALCVARGLPGRRVHEVLTAAVDGQRGEAARHVTHV